jgi:invasion protein IalB
VQAELPSGAETVTETYQDWQMICTQAQGNKRCIVTQQQTDPKTNQRIIAIELQPHGDNAEGVLVMPFGVFLDKGVTLKVGDANLEPVLRFRTCLPQGCVVPLNLGAKALATLRKATTVTVNAVSSADQAMAVPVSMKGFVPALDRATAITR